MDGIVSRTMLRLSVEAGGDTASLSFKVIISSVLRRSAEETLELLEGSNGGR